MSDISITVDGQDYVGWKSVNLRRSIEAVAGTFDFSSINQVDGQDWNLTTQAPCVLKIGSNVVLTGYIDEIAPSIGFKGHEISVRGRDKTCDLVDCAAVHKQQSWSGRTLTKLAEEFCKPFGIRVIAEGDVGAKFGLFSINKGDSAFMCIEKACRMRNVIPTTSGDGKLLLAAPGSIRADDNLIFGGNILLCNASYNYENRFSKYTVFSQTGLDAAATAAWGTANEAVGSYEDKEVKRYRPYLNNAESQSTSTECRNRAKWEALIRAGNSRVVSVTVQGWLQSTGKLWQVNRLTYVKVPPMNIDMDLLITEVSMVRDESGTMTHLTLKIPDAFNPGTKFKTNSSRDFKSTGDKHGPKAKQILGW